MFIIIIKNEYLESLNDRCVIISSTNNRYSIANLNYDFNNNPKYPTIFPVVRYCGGPLYYLSAKSLNVFKNLDK